MMLSHKAQSQRVPVETSSDGMILDTHYNNKRLRIWITNKPNAQPNPADLGDTDQVHVAILVNHHQVTQGIGGILKKAQTGEAVVVVCHTAKAYQNALTFLGYSKNHSA